jgi:purine-binding chemotaxis protein CheW
MNTTAYFAVSQRDSLSEGANRHQYVSFALGTQSYCVDIMSVREIRMLDRVTPVPGAEAYVRGVINLRGSIVPVIDMRMRFGEGQTHINSNHPAVIVTLGDRNYGLLVDVVSDILSVAVGEIADLPDLRAERSSSYFSGVIRNADHMNIIVDLGTLIGSHGGEQRLASA